MEGYKEEKLFTEGDMKEFSSAQFLQILFEPYDKVCFARTKFDTSIRSVSQPQNNVAFFSINALKGPRLDENVSCFRNFLLEFDSGTLEQNRKWLKDLPYSTCTFSGSKSYHFIISLQDPLYNIQEYKEIAARLHLYVPQADPSTKNPSRLSRFPGYVRSETGRVQALIELRGRVANRQLLEILPELSEPIVEHIVKSSESLSLRAFINTCVLQPDVAMQKLGTSGRNSFYFWLGKRLDDLGTGGSQKKQMVELSYSNLIRREDFSLQEALSAARCDKRE